MCFKCVTVYQQAIAARVNGEPCCDWVGEGGAGHFVKMVHNGIEYGDMQLICEAYHLMKSALGMKNDEMSEVIYFIKCQIEFFLLNTCRYSTVVYHGFGFVVGKEPCKVYSSAINSKVI